MLERMQAEQQSVAQRMEDTGRTAPRLSALEPSDVAKELARSLAPACKPAQ